MIEWIVEHLFPIGIVSTFLVSYLVILIKKCPIRYRLFVRRLAQESFKKIAKEIEGDEINFRYEEVVSKLLRDMSHKLKNSKVDIPLEKQIKVNQRMRVVAETLAGKLDVNKFQESDYTDKPEVKITELSQYKDLTEKQALYVIYRREGLDPLKAVKAAGYSHPLRALSRLTQNKRVQAALRKRKKRG